MGTQTTEENNSSDMIDKISKRLYNREDIINDIKVIFKMPEISSEAKSAIINDACWALTERKNPERRGKIKNLVKAPKAKIKGCDYWSKNAFEEAYKFSNGYHSSTNKRYLLCKTKSNVGNLPDKVFNEGKMVTHEHLIPKKVLIKGLFENTKFALEKLDSFLKWFKSCVITKEEDKQLTNYRDKMPNEKSFKALCDQNNDDCIWERYVKSFDKIVIYQIKWEWIGNGWSPTAIEDVIEISSKVSHECASAADQKLPQGFVKIKNLSTENGTIEVIK